jgi:hypothetical protein
LRNLKWTPHALNKDPLPVAPTARRDRGFKLLPVLVEPRVDLQFRRATLPQWIGPSACVPVCRRTRQRADLANRHWQPEPEFPPAAPPASPHGEPGQVQPRQCLHCGQEKKRPTLRLRLARPGARHLNLT